MQQFTFNEKAENKYKKESIEWLNIWCEDTNDDSLPRVGLIGDSITTQTHKIVKEELKGLANVDYLSTSYSILSLAYVGIIEKFIEDSKYDIIYFNYGLHGYGVTANEYENAFRAMIKMFLSHNAKVIIGLTTTVLEKDDLNIESERWTSVVKERNAIAISLAKEFNLAIDDLYSISKKLGKDGKSPDGVHFNDYGKEIIGKSKADSIKKLLTII
ncbi:MAG: SGNH/GDSL hydrolase family protein [Clostridiales bacterium]|nr:SGNH/GDSL hydrolase family protein [Clostridiales bacterium]